MLIDGGDLLHKCGLHLCIHTFASQFPNDHGKFGDESDMSNYRGITQGPVFAKLLYTYIGRQKSVSKSSACPAQQSVRDDTVT